jgi:hypothetical protein
MVELLTRTALIDLCCLFFVTADDVLSKTRSSSRLVANITIAYQQLTEYQRENGKDWG